MEKASWDICWNEVYRLAGPDSCAWEKLCDENGTLVYEGFTVDHKAFGPGRSFYPDGTPRMEGIWGIKGLLNGREFYPNGQIRFEGVYQLNQAYGPNEPVFGSFYTQNGKLQFCGQFKIHHGGVGYPMVKIPEGFGSVWGPKLPLKHLFMWDDARKVIREKGLDPDARERNLENIRTVTKTLLATEKPERNVIFLQDEPSESKDQS